MTSDRTPGDTSVVGRSHSGEGVGADDERFMAAALALGRRGLGRTAPKPSVGALVVRDGRIVGRGWTGDGGPPPPAPRPRA